MAALLSKAGKDLTVTVLLDALQQTKDFELSMSKKFGASVSLRSPGEFCSNCFQLHDILQETSPTPARPLQSISSSFDPHMGVYVQYQDKYVRPAAFWAPRILTNVAE
jgi:vacuolar protein sorting-associated protein 53